jgi:hypothetical protein
MPADWPDSLPQKLNTNGSEFQLGEGRKHFATDTGPGKMRRRSTAVSGTWTATMTMSAVQIETMRTFVETELVGGSLPFTFPPPRGIGDDLLVRFKEDGLPGWRHIGGAVWQVSFTLEVLP